MPNFAASAAAPNVAMSHDLSQEVFALLNSVQTKTIESVYYIIKGGFWIGVKPLILKHPK